MKDFIKTKTGSVFLGIILGLISVLLLFKGNPGNTAICVASFIRDIAGAIHLHEISVYKYYRPEIAGLAIGALIISLYIKKYKACISRDAITKFALGLCTMILAMVFLGDPFRMLTRMGSGDLNAIFAFIAFVVGVIIAELYKKNEKNNDKKTIKLPMYVGFISSLLLLVGVIILFFEIPMVTNAIGKVTILNGVKTIFAYSEAGPANNHALVIIAFISSVIFGAFVELSDLSFDAAIRDVIYKKKYSMLITYVIILVIFVVYNIIMKTFKLSFVDHPMSHRAIIWSIVPMLGIGIAVSVSGGDPIRQVCKMGAGSVDSAFYVLGMLAGAVISLKFRLSSAASSKTNIGAYILGGPSKNGMIVCIIAIIIIVVIGVLKYRHEQK